MKYHINLIQSLRTKEKRDESQRALINVFTMVAFAALLLAGAYTASNILRMRLTINAERAELERIEAEYRKYKTTRMIVDKEDIELLDRLQTGRIFWTRKLAAMAYHLPNQPPNPYWITRFAFNRNTLTVKGYGYISPQQEQLITIDDYLNSLRADTTFSDIFPNIFLSSTSRDDEAGRERVNFEYAAEKKSAAPRGGRRR
jgi:hypothetical protein